MKHADGNSLRTLLRVPEGFHAITPSLIGSDAAAALEFYKSPFGALELVGLSNPDGSKIMHSSRRLANSISYVTDVSRGMSQESATSLGGTSVLLNLYLDNADDAFDTAVQAGGTAIMPVSEMFCGGRFGVVSEPFGQVWCLATLGQGSPLEEVMEGAKEEFCGEGSQARLREGHRGLDGRSSWELFGALHK